ncbi:MAG: TIGR03808 family TAT-translocated repetitive protein [Stappiaceae bacterium]
MKRREFLAGMTGIVAGATLAGANDANASTGNTQIAGLRGSIEGADLGLRPSADDDQSRVLQRAIDDATKRGKPLFLTAGTYQVSNLKLPDGARLVGVPGRTRLVYRGEGHLFFAENVAHIGLEGLMLDGANQPLGDYTPGLLHFNEVADFTITDCIVSGSSKSGLAIDRSSGHITRNDISGASDAGIRSIEARGLTIRDNQVRDCGNGGILIHRWAAGEDGTIVSGNRVKNIFSLAGGTGQNGNGINVFRAHNVVITDNHVSDCAFSAIRSNAGSNVQISNNTCLRSGEVGIYSEFGFEGAVVTGNLVDGAAAGISIANFNEGGRLAICANNIVRNITTKGPYINDVASFGYGIWAEAETNVIGNVIENAPWVGIGLGWGPYLRNVLVSNNIIRQSGTGVIVTVVEGAGPALITGNMLQELSKEGIVGYRWNDKATRDLVAGNRGWHHLTINGNQVS